MADMTSLRFNGNKNERCRTALKQYADTGLEIEFIGYLDSVEKVDKVEPRRHFTRNRRHRALVVDLHQVNTGHFDEIKINHSHFSTFSNLVINSVGKMIHFRANVRAYQAQYNGATEIRYGLVNVFMLPMTKEWLIGLDAKYDNQLTVHQEECLLQIRHFVNKDYSRALPFLPPLERHKAGIINITNGYTKRTVLLQNIANKLANGVHLTKFTDEERSTINIQADPQEQGNLTTEDLLRQQIKVLKMKIKTLKQTNKQQSEVVGAYYCRIKQKDNTIKQLSDYNYELKQQLKSANRN